MHSIGMPEIVEPVENSKLERRDRAARALFSATEMVGGNKFETEFGRAIPTTKYPEYASRYQSAFVEQINRLAKRLSTDLGGENGTKDLAKAFAKLRESKSEEVRDAWGNEFRVERAQWYGNRKLYIVRGAGLDQQFNTADDMAEYVEARRAAKVVNPSEPADRIFAYRARL